MENDYNGCKNRSTWNVALWIDNDESMYNSAVSFMNKYKGKTPYQISLPRGKDYVIVAKYGDKTETLTLEKSIEPVYWVNILIWPGLLIDLGTGKMWKYSPTEYDISFQ